MLATSAVSQVYCFSCGILELFFREKSSISSYKKDVFSYTSLSYEKGGEIK